MAGQTIKSRILIKNGTASNWSTQNPILMKGELGIEIDTRKVKVGDGVTKYNELKYLNVPYDDLFGSDGKIKSELITFPKAEKPSLYEGTKSTLEGLDQDVISKYFETDHPGVTPKQGDVFVVTTSVEGTEYAKTAYFYDGSAWVAMNGTMDADKVIFTSDLTMAGNYTQVGNFTKENANTTGTVRAKGKSVMDVMTEMFAKELQPTITAQPAVSGFALTGAKAVEVGTKVVSATFGTAVLSKGSYTYGSANVAATGYSVDRVCTPTSMNKSAVVDAASGTDNNDGNGFIIGDADDESSNVVSSLKYTVTVSHGEGELAKTNLGNNSSPEVKVSAGSKTQTTNAYTGFRQFFYGGSSAKGADQVMNSAFIRSLTNSNKAYSRQTLMINVPAGAKRVDIAVIASAGDVVKKIINTSALNADVTSTFVKSTVQVEGANGYKAVEYNVWSFVPPEPYGNKADLEVTLG